MVLVSHPTGNTFVRALLRGLEEVNQLGGYATSLGFAGAPKWRVLLPPRLRHEVDRRAYEVPAAQLSAFPWRELARLLAQRLKWVSLIQQETGWACIDAVYRSLDTTVARLLPKWKRYTGLTCVHAYEDGALATLRAAREEGITASYDLPIAYWETSRRLLEAEAARLPEWEQTLVGTRDSEAKLQRKTEELETADLVVCPSNFVLNSIPKSLRASRRCVVARFGSPLIDHTYRRTPRKTNAPLRVLFAGSMSQRKGLADLFEAVNSLNRKDVELVVMGSPVADMAFYHRQCVFHAIFATNRPGHIDDDVLTFDAILLRCPLACHRSRGRVRALVQQEAMSCGLPLIVTPKAGAEDLIEEGRTGFLVPPGTPREIGRKIAWCADHPHELEGMRQAAMTKASELTWAG